MKDISIIQSINQIASRKSVDSTCRSRKKAKVDDLLANSISKFGKDMVEAIQQVASRLANVGESVKVVKDFYQDSKNILEELAKMNFTLKQCVIASKVLMENPQQVQALH